MVFFVFEYRLRQFLFARPTPRVKAVYPLIGAVPRFEQPRLIERYAPRLAFAVMAVVKTVNVCILSARKRKRRKVQNGNVFQNEFPPRYVLDLYANAHAAAVPLEHRFGTAKRIVLNDCQPVAFPPHFFQAERDPRPRKRLLCGGFRQYIFTRNPDIGNRDIAVRLAEYPCR